jgi:TolB-like protein/Flp pilus assembly protein TadD
MELAVPQVARFDCFEVDLAAGHLRKGGERIDLRDQAFRVLAMLLEHPGQVVTREELRQRLWADGVFVDFENGLNTAIGRLRAALGDSAGHPRFIETLPKRGYRFIGDVSAVPSTPAPTPRLRTRLVVLPFVNLGGDPSQEYFSDAMTDEVITALAGLAPQHLAVIARTTSMRYKSTHKDVARIGRELAVDYLIEGALRHAGNAITLNVQLIQVSDQVHLFAAKYEADANAIFRLQRTIALGVAAHIPSITDDQLWPQPVRKPTESLPAYNEYLKGRHEMWTWTPDGVGKARQHFEAALVHDPNFVPALDGLANLYWYLGFWGFLPPNDAESLRRFYCMRAFEIDPTAAETLTLVAYLPEKCRYEDPYTYNWHESLRRLRRARDLAPHLPHIRLRYASVLIVLGRADEAIAELEYALETDPLSVEVRLWLLYALYLGRHADEAVQHAQAFVDLEPEHYLAHMALGLAHQSADRHDESIAALRRAVDLSGGFPVMVGWLGLVLGLGGQTAEARTMLERLRAISAERFVLPTSFAWVYVGLGEFDEALAWMERAVDGHDAWIHVLGSYPFLDPLRADPRFVSLMRKLGLEPARDAPPHTARR